MNKISKFLNSLIIVVTLQLFVLKMLKLLPWSWALVLSPIWISISLLLIYDIVAGIIETIRARQLRGKTWKERDAMIRKWRK